MITLKDENMAKNALLLAAAIGVLAGCSGLPFIPFI